MSELNDEGPLRLAAGVVTPQEWERAAVAVLARRGRAPDQPADVWDALSRTTIEGVAVPALGTAERLAGRVVSVNLPDRTAQGWDVRSAVFDTDPATAAATAVNELENGATSLWLTLGEHGLAPEGLADALRPVHLTMAPVVVGAGAGVTEQAAAAALAEAIRAADGSPAAGTSLGADPIGRSARAGELPDASGIADTIGDIADLAADLGVGGFAVDARVAHDRGAGDAAELAYALAAGVQYARALTDGGLDAQRAFDLLEFRLAVTDDQFSSMAKLRAARALWGRVGQLSGAAGAMRIHAVTSSPMTTRYDPWVNLLRTTIAAFSAGVGGADAITVLPFDIRLGVPDAFGRRMARNISSLLVDESHVAAVADPAAGAYAVETLTQELAEAAWAGFQDIERAGGVLGALADGSLSGSWAQTATRRRAQVATRRRPITGVSEFPNLAETLPVRSPWSHDPAADAIVWSADFEALRDEPAGDAVFLATLGPIADHSARAGFVTNLLAAGGVAARSAGRTDTVEDVIAAYRGDRVVVLTGSDAAYAAWGADVITALRAAGAGTVMLAGKPVPELADLIDDHVAVGDDVVDFLGRVRAELTGVRA